MKNRVVDAVSATFAILFACVGNSFSQDWAISLVDNLEKQNGLSGAWKIRVGRIATSQSQLTNSSRLLRNTRYRRVPVGLYGWGGQAIWKSSNWSATLDVTADRDASIRGPFHGIESGARLQFDLSDEWFVGSNISYDFDEHHLFFASDVGYRKDRFSARLVGYSLDNQISGGFLFTQYQVADWLYLDAGLDYRSDKDSLEKLFGVRFYLKDEHTDFTIDYIYEGDRDRGETLRGRFRYRF